MIVLIDLVLVLKKRLQKYKQRKEHERLEYIEKTKRNSSKTCYFI
ncbi:hypothetical protein DR86_1678 [Francisella tularensis]|nr:hypothetical protein DR86_1678 [Francisella tularensis]